ncbi:hypothetical protein CCMA1212_010258 [Trichoderma ghanense]|uniref:Secreted protein n=1 Tax=Trichoderma ghanense TaxID=65468 RepID=A0ABY2GSX1_9HYPO
MGAYGKFGLLSLLVASVCFSSARWFRFMTGLAMESLSHYGSSPVFRLSRGFLLVPLFYTSFTAPDRYEQEDQAD